LVTRKQDVNKQENIEARNMYGGVFKQDLLSDQGTGLFNYWMASQGYFSL